MALFDGKEPSEEEKWTMLFDGASNILGHGNWAILISLEKQYIPITARLCFDCTNNVAKYEACIIGLQAVVESKVKVLKVYGDSALVIHQLRGEWETRDAKLIPYQTHIKELVEQFDEITFDYISRGENQLANALTTLSSMFALSQDEDMPLIKI